jgi:uncharacterized protein
MSWDIESFREKIESQHQFPGSYNFKFIVPKDKQQEVLDILPKAELLFKESSNGNYISINAKAEVESSQSVLEIYLKAHKIPGCMSL